VLKIYSFIRETILWCWFKQCLFYTTIWENRQQRTNTFKFKVCKSVYHCTIQINHQPDATFFQFIIRPVRPRTQHGYHHDTKVKPEAATAVIELLMMGGKTSETCWVINKCQKINWKIVASGWWFIWKGPTFLRQYSNCYSSSLCNRVRTY